MGYIAPNYNNIIIGEAIIVDKQVLYNNITIGEFDGIGHYAIVMYENNMITISDDLLGTGLMPIVLENGKRHSRVLDEGIPIIKINNKLSTLPEEDYLII